MYIELNERTIAKLNKRLITDLEERDNSIPADLINGIIDDLLCELERKEEEIEDMKQNHEEDYEYFGISESDFH